MLVVGQCGRFHMFTRCPLWYEIEFIMILLLFSGHLYYEKVISSRGIFFFLFVNIIHDYRVEKHNFGSDSCFSIWIVSFFQLCFFHYKLAGNENTIYFPDTAVAVELLSV